MSGYLVLARRPGERVIITAPDGQTIEIEFKGTHEGKLAFRAPKSFNIRREEVPQCSPQP